MKLLDIFLIVSGIILFILTLDIGRKQKFNALHFGVFFAIGGGLLLFTLFPEILTKLGNIFGLQRGADLLVYISIIFLFYFVLLLLRKLEDNKSSITFLVREIALQNAPKEYSFFPGQEIFVIPAYNEAEIIDQTLQDILDAGYKNIIVINDGSSDTTQKKLESFGEKILVLRHYKNRGQGAALETGFEYIRRHAHEEHYVVSYDSDGQHDIADVKKFRSYAEKYPEVEVFLGSRFLKESRTNISLGKKILLKGAIFFTYILSQIRLSDAHNGFRYMKSQALNSIHITIDGMGHASEIVDIIAGKHISYMEVPVHIHYSEYSRAKGQKISNSFHVISRVIWSKFFK